MIESAFKEGVFFPHVLQHFVLPRESGDISIATLDRALVRLRILMLGSDMTFEVASFPERLPMGTTKGRAD